MGLEARLENLLVEIQTLRQRLHDLAEENEGLRGDEAIQVSYKLDQLIAEFLRLQDRTAPS
ncbi:MAG: Spo0E family sporulation regulatory protein-aspartic acid phosphatase [Chitinophagales bacterium]